MVNGRELLVHFKEEMERKLEEIQLQMDGLESIERTDEISEKLERLKNQKAIITEVMELADDLAEKCGSLDLFLEEIAQHLPLITQLADMYSKEVGTVFSTIFDIISKISMTSLANRDKLYAARATELKTYFEALKAAGFERQAAEQIVASQGAPYSLEDLLRLVFERFQFQVDID